MDSEKPKTTPRSLQSRVERARPTRIEPPSTPFEIVDPPPARKEKSWASEIKEAATAFPEFMRKQIPRIPQIVLGCVFFIFGLNSFLPLFSAPPIPPEAVGFWSGLAATGYLISLLKATEILCGLSLILNRYTNLATVVLAPIVINIVAYHTFLDIAGAPMAIVVGGLYLHLLFNRRKELKILLRR